MKTLTLKKYKETVHRQNVRTWSWPRLACLKLSPASRPKHYHRTQKTEGFTPLFIGNAVRPMASEMEQTDAYSPSLSACLPGLPRHSNKNHPRLAIYEK